VESDRVLAHALSLPGAWRDEPWDGDVVAKVGPKIFAFLGGDGSGVGLKCGATREEADEWLHRYPGDASVMAYIGRHGWNTLRLDGAIPDDELVEAVDASYAEVVSRLPRRLRPPTA
jgi:predicted DNA-binding protein (MmcQ/YjbR family)